MAVTSQNGTVVEDGKNKEAISFTFSNGAKTQLEELKEFFKAPSELDLIKLAISILQNFKEKARKGEVDVNE